MNINPLWRGRSPLDMVAEFHRAFDHPIKLNTITADTLASDLAFQRMDFHQEELDEMWEAMRNNDPVAFVDAVVDLLYFLCGTALALGIPLEAAFAEVHRSNMAKVWPDGTVRHHPKTRKVLKPEGWMEPDLQSVLAKNKPI